MNFENDENLDYQLNKVASVVIKEKRLRKGYSLEELATKLNNIVTRQSLYRYENNEARMKNNIFKKICLALNENPTDVWNEINNRFFQDVDFDNATYIKPIEDDKNMVQIPVLGTIKAGIPIEAQEDILEYIEIPKTWLRGGKHFYGLKISGDSMYPKYQENDIVVFEDSRNYDLESARNKDCAVMVNGDDATFKKVLLSNDGITLVPYNTGAYDLMMYSNKDIVEKPIKIIGIAREKRTRV